MKKNVNPIPSGYHSVTLGLTVSDAAKAIDFYQKAFGAEEISRFPSPDGKIMHAEIRIGDSIVMLSDEFPDMGNASPSTLKGTSCGIMIYCKNADEMYQRAIKVGAREKMPMEDQFWGDRYGRVQDPFGHEWSLATRQENLTAAEMQERAQKAFSVPPKK